MNGSLLVNMAEETSFWGFFFSADPKHNGFLTVLTYCMESTNIAILSSCNFKLVLTSTKFTVVIFFKHIYCSLTGTRAAVVLLTSGNCVGFA